MYGDPRPGRASTAAVQARQMLRAHVRRVGEVGEVGRLRVGEEQAVDLFHAAACGTVLTLLAAAEKERDPSLSPLARDAALAAITTDTPAVEAPGSVGAAVALRAALGDVTTLTTGEHALMQEWLDRIAAG
jgi:hypothetical protein